MRGIPSKAGKLEKVALLEEADRLVQQALGCLRAASGCRGQSQLIRAHEEVRWAVIYAADHLRRAAMLLDDAAKELKAHAEKM